MAMAVTLRGMRERGFLRRAANPAICFDGHNKITSCDLRFEI